MEIEFVKTQDGWVNTRYVVLVCRPSLNGEKQDYYEIHYQFGGDARPTRAALSDGDQMLGLTLTV